MIGVFANETDLLAATRDARDGGLEIVDAYTPYAVHGLDRAMGLRPSRLTWACFLCGLLGTVLILWFQFWTSALDWPINVGGKPFNSLPAFIPITFEICVLFAGVGVVAALLLRCRLYPGRAARLPCAGATDDRFLLVVRSPGAARDTREVRALLERHHAAEITEERA